MRFTFPQSVGLRFEIQPQFVLKGVLTQAFFKKKEKKPSRSRFCFVIVSVK